ncbi:GMC oxidoreductase [Peniophora sp. CONT]|nr:GMC oxidoreductase [Peniophora sp. CONT]
MLAQIDQVADKTFDYVVLSGLVVATRLSEDPALSILVLEAGQANLGDPAILSPLKVQSHFGDEKYDWNYKTTAQSGLGGETLTWPRGKGLGGSSAINFMQYHLPPRSDVDAFEKLGNKGWNWERLRPYYLKCENFVPPVSTVDAVSFDESQHGKDGPITVSYSNAWSNLETPFMQTMESLGIPRVKEPINGTWITPVNIDPKTGLRSYVANGYYEPASERPNLLVLSEANVVRVETANSTEGQPLVASSVAFLYQDRLTHVSIGKEVILSAGYILELSGIGDEKVLSKAGVALKHALPGVGNNAQEHVRVFAAFEMRDDPENKYQTLDFLRNPEEVARHFETYKATLSGPLALFPVTLSFSPLSAISPDHAKIKDELRASLSRAATSGKYSAAVQKQHAIQLAHIKDNDPSCELCFYGGAFPIPGTPQPEANRKYVSVTFLTNHPFSRGSIHISNGDPSTPADIDPEYFSEQYDLDVLVEGIKFTRRVMQTEPLKSIVSDVELCPGPGYETDEKIAEFVKKTLSTTFHTAGTCSMLPLEDDGVVDNDLKVYGTENIRVVDISIVPLQISAHLQTTAYAIGEVGMLLTTSDALALGQS